MSSLNWNNKFTRKRVSKTARHLRMLMKLGLRSIFWFFEKTRKQMMLPEKDKILTFLSPASLSSSGSLRRQGCKWCCLKKLKHLLRSKWCCLKKLEYLLRSKCYCPKKKEYHLHEYHFIVLWEDKCYILKMKTSLTITGINIIIIFWFFEKTRNQMILPEEEENITTITSFSIIIIFRFFGKKTFVKIRKQLILSSFSIIIIKKQLLSFAAERKSCLMGVMGLKKFWVGLKKFHSCPKV